jgi:hypothetical protein
MALVTSIMIVVGNTCAQSIPKPSAPEFTVSFVDRSYTVPITATQTTDPFTGQQVTQTSGGQYVKNQTLDIKIRNPALTSATLPNGTVANLYYTVRTKGHFYDYWPTAPVNRWSSTFENGDSFTRVFASTSDNTVMTLVIGSPNDIIMGNADVYIPTRGQEDFQVEASYGYQYTTYAGLYPTGTDFVSYADSGWSNTQTITLGETSAPPSPTPTVPEFPVIAFLPLFLCLLAVAVIVKHRKAGVTR